MRSTLASRTRAPGDRANRAAIVRCIFGPMLGRGRSRLASWVLVTFAGLASVSMLAPSLHAQESGATGTGSDPSPYAEPAPEQRFETSVDPAPEVEIVQRLGAMVPLDATFRDRSGATVELGQYFGERPVILALVYFECPQLCTQILNALTSQMRAISKYDAGTDYQVVAISIDPRETPELAAHKEDAYVRRYAREGGEAGLHFLVGDKVNIDRVAKAVGYGYLYDPRIDEYSHAAGIMIATPDGRLSHYFYGMEYSARDIQLALVESSDGKIGSLVDAVRLLCLRYDPTSGRYGFAVMTSLRILGLVTLAALVLFIVRQVTRERARRALEGAAGRGVDLHAAKDPAAEL